MLPAVDFHGYFQFKTKEIHNITANRLLAFEFEPCVVIAQFLPQGFFSICGIAAELSGGGYCFWHR